MSDYRSKYGQAPGWYHHPTQPGLRAYFDGESWTGEAEPITGTAASSGLSAPVRLAGPGYLTPARRSSRALEWWGIVMAFLFPLVAIVIGIRLLFLRPFNGLALIAFAFAVSFLEVAVLRAML